LLLFLNSFVTIPSAGHPVPPIALQHAFASIWNSVIFRKTGFAEDEHLIATTALRARRCDSGACATITFHEIFNSS
jgi:hypothetical protein